MHKQSDFGDLDRRLCAGLKCFVAWCLASAFDAQAVMDGTPWQLLLLRRLAIQKLRLLIRQAHLECSVGI